MLAVPMIEMVRSLVVPEYVTVWCGPEMMIGGEIVSVVSLLVVSFAVAWVSMWWLLRFVSTHTFRPFAWYRIVFGLIVLLTAYTGVVDWSA